MRGATAQAQAGGGNIIKFLFIAFNILMIIWRFSYFVSIGDLQNAATSEAEGAGVAIGVTMGIGMLMTVWAFGDIALGILVLLTRRKNRPATSAMRNNVPWLDSPPAGTGIRDQ